MNIIKSTALFLNKCKVVRTLYVFIETRIGHNIRMPREKAGMAQDVLAAKMQLNGCDITRSAVAKIEVGQHYLYPDEIILIKNILKCSYEDIFSQE